MRKSHGWSRIDRTYLDLHAAHWLYNSSFCTRLEHTRHLSDHSPVSFGIKKRPRKRSNMVPTWFASDEDFAAEVKNELEYLVGRVEHNTDLNAMQHIEIS